MRIAIGIFVAALFATPALSSEIQQPDLVRWVSNNTDMSPAQVAIAGPDNIYSVERLGAPASTGEVIALVRTESLKANWSGPRSYGSWDAHIIFDCKAERLRVIRSASYPEPNREGEAKVDTRVTDWFTPSPNEPSARLMAAACDASFPWPLRATQTFAKVSTTKLPIIEEAEPRRPAGAEPAVEASGEAVAPAAPTAQSALAGLAPEDVSIAAKPAGVAFEHNITPVAPVTLEQPVTLDRPQRIELAVADTLERPELSLAPAKDKRLPAISSPKLRFAGLTSPFAKVASLGKRLFADGTRMAGLAPRHAKTQHASLGESAPQRVANLARAGPGLD